MTGQCPACHRWFGLTDRGTMRTHRVSGSRRAWCSGTALRPVWPRVEVGG